jgi:uncharacterized tellurite resistance protein B-like protein
MLDPTKLEHFRNLIALSAADGQVLESERVALSKIAFELGLPLDRLNVMIGKASEYIYIVPQNQQERLKQLKEMIELAMVDEDFAKAERDLIITVGKKLGFAENELDDILAQS